MKNSFQTKVLAALLLCSVSTGVMAKGIEVTPEEFRNVTDLNQSYIVTPKIADFTLNDVKHGAELASYAYDGNEGISKLKAMGYEAKHFGTEAEHNSGQLLFSKDGKVTINYRGTASLRNLATDLSCLETTTRISNGLVHNGIYNGFQASWDKVYTELFNYAKSQGKTVAELDIDVQGHSLGGGMAMLAALRLHKVSGVNNLRVKTFGQPRVFNTVGAREYDELLGSKTLRVTEHNSDPVPGVGFGWMGYKHAGLNLRLEKPSGYLPHVMDGYIAALNTLTSNQFVAKNENSWLALGAYVRPIDNLYHTYVWNNVAHGLKNLKKSIVGESTYIEDIYLNGANPYPNQGKKSIFKKVTGWFGY